MRATHATMLILLSFCLLGPVLAVEYASTDVPKTIPDLQTITSTITITDTATITDLDVKLDLDHSYPSDLVVYLIGPGGSPRCHLYSYQWWWWIWTIDDEGGYWPAEPLSVFDGMSLAGTWTLEITDEWGADSGELYNWSLIATTDAPTDTTPPVVTLTSCAPAVLWPPNGKPRTLTVCGTITDDVAVDRAWCEIDDEYGTCGGTYDLTLDGDGNFTITPSVICSRLEDDLDGRTFEITICAVDACGNEGQAVATVTAPHDVRKTK